MKEFKRKPMTKLYVHSSRFIFQARIVLKAWYLYESPTRLQIGSGNDNFSL